MSSTDGSTIKEAFAGSWSSMPVQDLMWVNETTHNISKTGKVFIALPVEQHISVLAGDILGLHWESAYPGELILQTSTSDPVPEFAVDIDTVAFASRETTGFQLSSASVAAIHTGDHLVMAHVVRHMKLKVRQLKELCCIENLGSGLPLTQRTNLRKIHKCCRLLSGEAHVLGGIEGVQHHRERDE